MSAPGKTPEEEPMPRLRMAPEASAEELAHRFERERRAMDLKREDHLSTALAGFKVGSVPFLNAVPLTRGLEEQIQFVQPSELGRMMERGELDAALLSVTEALLKDRYDILDGIAIASLGEVRSVLLAHRGPIEEIKEVALDPASLTSVNLLKVLLAERGVKPVYRTLEAEDKAENFLLIGDRAIEFSLSNPDCQLWDLGEAWMSLTGLPFVYAVWVLQRGRNYADLKHQLHEAKAFGLDTLDSIIVSRDEFTLDFRRDYLGWHIHYHLGSDEKRGLARFIELLRKHGLGPVYEPRFVS